MRVGAAGILGGAAAGINGGLLSVIGSLGRGVDAMRNPNLPGEFNNRILDLKFNNNLTPQQKSIEAAKIAQQFGSYFGINKGDRAAGAVGADNQRFLTRGPGPIKTPELTALEKMAKALEDLGNEKLPELLAALKAFGPIGVIDN